MDRSVTRQPSDYRVLFERAAEGIVVTDPGGTILDANPAALAMTGYTLEELRGLHATAVMPPPDLAAEPFQISRVHAEGRLVIERRIVRKDGSLVPVEIGASPLPDGRVLAMIRDIGARLETERTLRESEARYRDSERRLKTLLDRASDLIYTIDRDGVLTEMNQALVELTGWSRDELVGKPVTQIIHPEDIALSAERLRQVHLGTTTPVREFRIRTKSGDYKTIESSTMPEVRDGEVVAAFGIARDVTERRREQAERERLAESFRLILESAYEGICSADSNGRCTLANRSAAAMFGYEPEDLLGKSLHVLTHHHRPDGTPFPIDECPLLAVVKTGNPIQTEDLFFRRDGSSFPVVLTGAPIVENGVVTGVVASFVDVSQQKALEKDLETAKRLTVLGNLAATIAHEFNNVLMGVQPFAEVIERRSTDEKSKRAAEQILHSVKRGRRVTEEILRFTRPAEPVRQRVTIGPWLDHAAAGLRALLPSSVSLAIRVDDQSLAILGDPEQIGQVLSNLVTNARDSMSQGGAIEIHASAQEGGGVHMAVSDTGGGMPSDVAARVFEPFFTTKRVGTGLGLAVAHQIVTLHGGSLKVDSKPGIGTTFHILLPSASDSAPAVVSPPPALSVTRTLPRSVVLVEDEHQVAAGITSMLEAVSIVVVTVDRGSAAVGTIERVEPEAVILDIELPDVDGVTVYERIHARWPDLPVVFSTGHADKSKLEPLLLRPHVGFLMKPYDSETLLASLADVLAE